MTNNWDLAISYEPQLGSLLIQPRCPHVPEPERAFRIPLQGLLRALGVPPAALRQLLQDAAKAAPPAEDLETLCQLALPEDLTGWTVLDIGGYDGRFARMALDRGASRAVCLDSDQWQQYGWQQPPHLPGVEYVTGDFLTWDEPADLVLFYNVLYHTQHPWQALSHLRNLTRRQMALASLTVWTDEPVWRLYAPRECNPEDDTVYWGPSESGLLRLLALTGWRTEVVGKAVERLVLRAYPLDERQQEGLS